MGILLTEEEYEIVHKHEGHERTFVNVWTVEPYLKAQALKVLDELEKPCPHVAGHNFCFYRKDCCECMAEIRKELEGVAPRAGAWIETLCVAEIRKELEGRMQTANKETSNFITLETLDKRVTFLLKALDSNNNRIIKLEKELQKNKK